MSTSLILFTESFLIYPILWINLQLQNHGENHITPLHIWLAYWSQMSLSPLDGSHCLRTGLQTFQIIFLLGPELPQASHPTDQLRSLSQSPHAHPPAPPGLPTPPMPALLDHSVLSPTYSVLVMLVVFLFPGPAKRLAGARPLDVPFPLSGLAPKGDRLACSPLSFQSFGITAS